MSSWVETTSPSFAARHDEADAEDVVGVLELLEGTRERLATVLPDRARGPRASSCTRRPPSSTSPSRSCPSLRRLTAPAVAPLPGRAGSRRARSTSSRRGRCEARASNVPGSREMLLLTPAALYAQLAAGLSNPAPAAAAAPALRRAPTRATRGWPPAPASGSPARRRTPAPRSPGACARAASRRSRPASATRSCSAAPCSTCSRARRASRPRPGSPIEPPGRRAAHARARLPRALVRPHAGSLARAPRAARRDLTALSQQRAEPDDQRDDRDPDEQPGEDPAGRGRRGAAAVVQVDLQQDLARGLLAGLRHEHVARAGGEHVRHVEPARAAHEARHALLEQQVRDEVRLGLVAPGGDRDEVALRVLAA